MRLADPAETLAVLEQEARASAELAKASRFPAPEPVALGKPGAGYPMPWSVQTWVPGTVAFDADPSGSDAFAEDLAAFIAALRSAETRGRRFSGQGRGGVLAHHDNWMAECFEQSDGLLDAPGCARRGATSELPRKGADVMSHGDLIPGSCAGRGRPAQRRTGHRQLRPGRSRAGSGQRLAPVGAGPAGSVPADAGL
ncbi:phosphotransferase [Streptomyces sp. KL116D]|uniref:phosphotransferase n=1 Tax=Streptomyces sp. KL116D TaxID=3045152 RepID=UPI00355896E4